jgi:phospholipid/cholesterol/gamma-HCH transport system substrate-binding protein
MPSQQEVHWSQLKVGVIVIVATIILVTLLFLMTSASGLGVFSKKIVVDVYFENSAGLKEGAAVDLQGVTIGTVSRIAIVTDPARKLTPVCVTLKLDKKFQPELKEDSKAALTTVGVLGDTVVDINSQIAVGPPLQNGDELKTLETPSLTDVVKASQGTIEQVNVILAKMNTIVDNIQAGKGTVGQLMQNPSMYNKADSAIAQINTLGTNLNAGKGSAGKFLTDDELYHRLDNIAAKLEDISTDLNAGKGSAGKFLKDDTLYNNLNHTLTQTNQLLSDVQHGKGAAGMLINDPEFAKQLRDTVTRVNNIVTGIDDGRGTLGKLATDDQLYTNLNKTVTETTLLVSTIRQDPKKYLTIHMKIF